MVEGVVRERKRLDTGAGRPNNGVTAAPTRKASYLRLRGVNADHPGEGKLSYRGGNATPAAANVEDHPTCEASSEVRQQSS
jgi:hypothetical protein